MEAKAKKRASRLVGTALFWALLALAVAASSALVERKDSRAQYGAFFSRAGEIDVLFLGSSHIRTAVYPMELWNDYGITAYNFGGYNNTMAVCYWMLESALERCAPKAVVLDIDGVGEQEKLGRSSADLHTALDGMPLGPTKLRALADLLDDPDAMDDYGNRYRDLFAEYVFPLALYHGRWSELTANDLHPALNGELGAETMVNVAEPAEYAIVSDALGEEGEGFVYLRKIVALCRERGIEVLLTHAPYPCPNENDELRWANAVYNTAQELGVEFVDFVYMDQVVDYRTDCFDPASHLNASGARKVTDYLGRLLSDAYGVPDRRGEEPLAARWNADYAAYREKQLRLLGEQADPASFLMLLQDAGLSACALVPAGSRLWDDERLTLLLQNAARRRLFEEDTYDSVFADGLFPLERAQEAAQGGEAYLAVIDRAGGAPDVREAVGGGTVEASFGSAAFAPEGAGLTLECGGETYDCFAQAGDACDVCVAVLDARTGALLMTRSYAAE